MPSTQPATRDNEERYLIRSASRDDDPAAVRALLKPVDFLDAAMPE
ncbi:hypothetical protein OOK58_00550 [Streptomyces sp. NBC_01728]|nr:MULTISPECIES: hypothetical protein [unclassified Streptomyces]MCX4461211.1 hypothetical protein [Streptomyces sp. NBC_01719]MCX4490119.1 hypothetical protein [Streptomyces sp. NBC_01728]MCX4596868.1 hypothetical protein [Streptomyces sp. NBC_01549]